MSVNVSPLQLLSRSFVTDVACILEESGLAADRLVLEVTETALHDIDQAEKVLLKLRRIGVRIALDDFGTGYSSLGHLRRLPIDLLKIDRSFVNSLDDAQGSAILHTIVQLARTLGMRVCAEGVESREQADAIRELGIQECQGWLFGHPLPARRFERLHLLRLLVAS